MSPPPMLLPGVQTPQKKHQNQSLASHFHMYPLIEKLSKEIEAGSSDSLVSELNIRFENCQQMLNSISGSIGSAAMTVDGQKLKLEESEKLLEQRRLLYNMGFVSHWKSKKPDEERN